MTTAVLIHGLGSVPAVWGPTEERLRSAGLTPVTVTLPGHAGEPGLRRWSFAGLAEAVAAQIGPRAEPWCVIGHSLGGVVGLCLASGWFGFQPVGVAAVGVKVAWTAEDIAGARRLAGRPPRVMGSREDAVAWAAKLAGVTDPDMPGFADQAVARRDEGWVARWDPTSAALSAPPMDSMLAAARCPVILGRGAQDHMVSDEDLAALDAKARTFVGVGHDLPGEAPDVLADLAFELLRGVLS